MAFVSSFTTSLATGFNAAQVSTFTSKPSVAVGPARRYAAVSMDMDPKTKGNMIPDGYDPSSKGTKIPQGFTFFAEQLNGRAAMFGFALAIATEIINPNHPGIVAQIASIVKIITNT
jgi:hypothetical protein